MTSNPADKALQAISVGSKKALAEICMNVQSAAVNLAPIRDGILRSSATITDPETVGGKTSQTVTFPVVYAAVQHEREDFNHPRGGQAKYLSDAIEQVKPQIPGIISQHIGNGG